MDVASCPLVLFLFISVSVASKQMSQKFGNARKFRRAIIAELEQQQKADSQAAREIRNCILANTRELLQSLSRLLETYGPQQEVGEPERRLFSTIAPSVSLDDWLRLREEHAASERRAESLGEGLRDAQKGYDEVAPLGVVSKLFKNPNEKLIVDAMKSRRDKIASDVSAVNTETSRLENVMQQQAEKFLGAAMSKDSLEYLRSTLSPVSKRVKETLVKMTDEVQRLVNTHSATQSSSLAKVQDNVTSLSNSYEG